MFAHLAAVRHRAAGQWVVRCAPSLAALYLEVQGRYFAARAVGGLLPNAACDAAAEQAARAASGTPVDVAFALAPPPRPAGAAPPWEKQMEQLRNMGVSLAIFAAAGFLLSRVLAKQA